MTGVRVGAWVGFGMLLGAMCASAVALVSAQQYAGQVIFSASDADVGRTMGALDQLFLGANRLSGVEALDSSKYYEGRFSNGITYAEILPGRLGYQYDPATNFAWGGAATGPYALTLPVANDNNTAALADFLANPTAEGLASLVQTIVTEAPEYAEDPTTIPLAVVFQLVPGQHSMSTQVDEYLADNPTTPSDRLYMIGPAYNDYFAYHQRDPSVPAANQEAMMTRLYEAGARDFAIFAYGGETEFGSEYSREIVERSNRFQREHPGAKVYVVDFDGGVAEIKRDPAHYGFSDNFAPCFGDGLYLEACPDDRLYYDSVHPTRTGHQIVADLYYATISSAYQGPRQLAQLPEMGRLATAGPQREISTRISGADGGILAAEGAPGTASGSTEMGGGYQLWLRTGLGFGNREGNPDAQDFDYNSFHGVVGIDRLLPENITLGLAASFSSVSIDYDGVGGEADVYSYGLTAYGGWRMGRLSIEGQGGYALNRYRDVARATGFPDRPTASGSPDGNTWYASLATSVEMMIEEFKFIPRIALAYARTKVDAYAEDGSILLDFTVNEQEVSSLRSVLGAAVERGFDAGELGPVLARLTLGWEHEFEDGNREVLGVFPNGAEHFVQTGGGRPDALLVGLGALFRADLVQPGARLHLTYDARFGDDGQDHLFSVALRVPFD